MQQQLDHEKLDVYQAGLRFVAWSTAGKDLLVRIVSMLTKLVDRFSSCDHVREEQIEYGDSPLSP
ncbi:MAG: hypothetical protein RBT78_12260 [Kiritimatiellia bacterium]|jgi:hypothetical protein|nr:hypothetical protein [Kiritimatiellia bacterium]